MTNIPIQESMRIMKGSMFMKEPVGRKWEKKNLNFQQALVFMRQRGCIIR